MGATGILPRRETGLSPAGHILKKSVPWQIYCIKAYEEDFSEWVPAD